MATSGRADAGLLGQAGGGASADASTSDDRPDGSLPAMGGAEGSGGADPRPSDTGGAPGSPEGEVRDVGRPPDGRSLDAEVTGPDAADPDAGGPDATGPVDTTDAGAMDPPDALDASAHDAAPPEAPCAPRPYVVPAGCPFEGRVEVVIWTVGGWNLLAEALAANPSPCAHYYISAAPFAADHTTLRPGEAARIRARGPQFHALAEFQDSAWGEWRAARGATWAQAAAEFRARAREAGYCLGEGDGWVVNEVHSDARRDPASRDRLVTLFRALHEGEPGGADDAPGAVAVIGMGHATVNMDVYQPNLQGWLADRDFWEGVAPHVRWWAQESYVDTRLTCVAGDRDARAAHINAYTMHVGRQAVVAPDGAGVNTAQSYFSRAYVPMLNAVWGSLPENGYGDTDVPLDTMLAFVADQVYATRRYADANAHPGGRISFAFKSYRTPTEYAAIGARLAAAIAQAYAPGAEPVDACAGGLCACVRAGAGFNDAWEAFQRW